MKTIFLDIDGVLNSHRTQLAYSSDSLLMSTLDPVAVRILQRIVRESGANIVISSTWRRFNKWQDVICQALWKAGWEGVPPIIGRTAIEYANRSRGQEIELYCLTHDVKDYIILDDDTDMLESQQERFINTDFTYGLGFKEYIKIDKLWELE